MDVYYLSNLVAFQSGDLLWELLVGGVAQAQPAIVAIPKGEQLPISGHHCRVLEPTGHLDQDNVWDKWDFLSHEGLRGLFSFSCGRFVWFPCYD